MSGLALEYHREHIKREIAKMSEKKWEITYKDMPWSSVHQGVASEGMGFYEISFDGHRYGFISKEAWDEQKTGDILKLVEQMLNDAHSLALREHD